LGPRWSVADIRRHLLDWYRGAARDLPWRRTRDPYRIWVSEIMLQQTRVAAVIPYYERFLERFPTVEALAAAPEQDLLAMWAGLGYYSRARNLQKAARQIVDGAPKATAAVVGEGEAAQVQVAFPSTYEAIRELPGVGDYTAAAVASIAFGLPHGVLDGNVARVFARLAADWSDISAPATRKRFQQWADALVDPADPGAFNQAVMELGATVCLPKNPMCLVCPLSGDCAARAQAIQSQLPVKGRRLEIVAEEKTYLLITRPGEESVNREKRSQSDRARSGKSSKRTQLGPANLDERTQSATPKPNPSKRTQFDHLPSDCWILLRQHEAGSRRLAGFWELPEAEHLPDLQPGRPVGEFRHGITRHDYHCTVREAAWKADAPEGFRWFRLSELELVPVTTAATKALRSLSLLHH
jgi:A/G-specific adenine glycosylase